ncbi:MAG: 3-phosphoglycerate dehydrogenase [Deltaproteobacteria bacterium RIFOXYD12_FULL_57_12]|nr:MAG: 3-phosphoglycerate dehydrogenase [Deltaproteobacteria bacterium RIFOXYD12_FULL_57_12]
MAEFRVKIINKIDQEGLALFGARYQVGAEVPDPQAIIVRSSPVDTDAYPGLLAVARAGAGVNNITVDRATEKGICVFNTPGANANAVAELVFTMLGVWIRNIHRGIEFCRNQAGRTDEEISRTVEAQKAAFRGVELAGKSLGVLGLGKIGVLVANGGIQRHMRAVGFDPFPALENIHQLSPEVALARSLAEVVREADILSIHVPLNSKTRGFVNRGLIEQMKHGALLVNYARGEIVDETAVLAALDSGQLGGYLADFPTAVTVDHPQILVSPHLGASTEESEENSARLAVKELKAYLEYGTVIRSVNFPVVESIPSGNCHSRFIMINRDVPGMIGFASQAIGARGINIVSYLNESNGVIGYNIIDLEAPIPADLVAAIEAHPGVIRTRVIPCAGV